MITHARKILPRHFEARINGRKDWEIRREDDARFEVGDFLVLREWTTEAGAYTGNEEVARITHVVRDAEGIAPGFAILSTETVWVHHVPAHRSSDPEGDLRELMIQALQLPGATTTFRIVGAVQELKGRVGKAEARVRELEQPQAPVESVEVTAPPMDRSMQEQIGADIIAGRLRVACGVIRADGVLDLHLVAEESAKIDDADADEPAGIPTDMAVDVGHAGSVAGFADPAAFTFTGKPDGMVRLPGAAGLSSIVRDIQSSAECAGEAAP